MHAGCGCGLAGPEQCHVQANTIILKIHDFVCILGLVIWGSIITVVRRFLHSKLDEWGYFILTIASETQYLLYGSKICDTSNPKCRFSLQSSTGSKKTSGRGGCSAICLHPGAAVRVHSARPCAGCRTRPHGYQAGGCEVSIDLLVVTNHLLQVGCFHCGHFLYRHY